MIKISTAITLACIFQLAVSLRRGAKEVFDMTADDMLEAVIGKDHFQKKFEDLRQNMYKSRKEIMISHVRQKEMLFNLTSTTTRPTRMNFEVTPIPKSGKPPRSMAELNRKMKKMEILYLLRRQESNVIPDFQNDGDGPDHLTRRFDAVVEKLSRRQARPGELKQYHGHADVLHHLDVTPNTWTNLAKGWGLWVVGSKMHRDMKLVTNRMDKEKLKDIMTQFIYMTRYKLYSMEELRKKYKSHVRYKIGYCFAAMKLVRNQQKSLYSTLMLYNDTLTSAVTHLQLYYKIMRLDVDLKDLVRYVRRLNHEAQLRRDPTYYDDEEELFQLPEM